MSEVLGSEDDRSRRAALDTAQQTVQAFDQHTGGKDTQQTSRRLGMLTYLIAIERAHATPLATPSGGVEAAHPAINHSGADLPGDEQ